ncbi:MAG: hypothetical protein HY867_13620 [Chloroflexi bacterium]|nr:hypothetical protein [Chloroflexota bacterium]
MNKNDPTLNDILAVLTTGFADVDKRFGDFRIKLDVLTTSVDGLAQKVNSYLTQEWAVHLHNEHPELEKRLRAVERKLGMKVA